MTVNNVAVVLLNNAQKHHLNAGVIHISFTTYYMDIYQFGVIIPNKYVFTGEKVMNS